MNKEERNNLKHEDNPHYVDKEFIKRKNEAYNRNHPESKSKSKPSSRQGTSDGYMVGKKGSGKPSVGKEGFKPSKFIDHYK